MTSYEFIFSDKPAKRLLRHFVFWFVLVDHFIIQNLMIGGVNEVLKPRSLPDSAFNALFFFPFYILSVYIFIYFIFPDYFLRGKYTMFICSLACLQIIDIIACNLSGMLYMHVAWHIPFHKINFESNKYNTIVNGLFLPVTVLWIAGGIKLAKNWYLQQKESERLAKEKILRELQLLKTQLHPRFLFHALSAVKKHIRLNSPNAANLIISLSDLLSYILYESDKDWMLLEKEFEIIKTYIELEKKSAECRLETEVNISGITTGKYISPLLLLSFIENSFDYFLKGSQKDQSLNLNISVWDNHLDYHLICNRFMDKHTDPAEVKMKFTDLQKQLNHLYPGSHEIEIITNSQNITIVLNLPVHFKDKDDDKTIAAQNELYELL